MTGEHHEDSTKPLSVLRYPRLSSMPIVSSPQKVNVRSNLNHIAVGQIGGNHQINKDLSMNFEISQKGAKTGLNFFDRGSSSAM